MIRERQIYCQIDQFPVVTLFTANEDLYHLVRGYLLVERLIRSENDIAECEINEDIIRITRAPSAPEVTNRQCAADRKAGCGRLDIFASVPLPHDFSAWQQFETEAANQAPLQSAAVLMPDLGLHVSHDLTLIQAAMHSIGTRISDRSKLGNALLLVNNLITAELVLNTLVARIPIILSTRPATALAIQTARIMQMTLVEKSPKGWLVHSFPDRIHFQT